MSKIHTEEKEVFGFLFTEYGTFKMIAKHPNKSDVPWYLKDMGVLSFFVVDHDDFGKNILLRGDFIIKPLSEKLTAKVHFLIEEENIKVEESEELPF